MGTPLRNLYHSEFSKSFNCLRDLRGPVRSTCSLSWAGSPASGRLPSFAMRGPCVQRGGRQDHDDYAYYAYFCYRTFGLAVIRHIWYYILQLQQLMGADQPTNDCVKILNNLWPLSCRVAGRCKRVCGSSAACQLSALSTPENRGPSSCFVSAACLQGISIAISASTSQ